jgi:hypothetical protein
MAAENAGSFVIQPLAPQKKGDVAQRVASLPDEPPFFRVDAACARRLSSADFLGDDHDVDANDERVVATGSGERLWPSPQA